MKTLKTLIPLFVSLLFSCEKEFTESHVDREVTVFIDRTDTMVSCLNSQSLIHFLELDVNLWQGVIVKIIPINDKDYNPVIEIRLQKDNDMLTSKAIREARVGRFKKELADALESLSKPLPPTQHSIIYRPVATEANRLTQSKAQMRNVIIVSDWEENSIISFYGEGLNKVQAAPQETTAQLLTECPLKNLKGIQFYFLYKPRSYEDNLRYRTASSFFKSLFESRNAACFLAASLN